MIDDIRNGVVPPLRSPAPFRLAEGVVAFVQGPASVAELRAAGDGSYSVSSPFVFGWGTVGLAAVGAQMAANASARKRAQRQAMADAQVMFRHQFDATMYVTNTGWVFHTPSGVFTWLHTDVHAMEMIEPNAVVMQGNSDRGRLTWRIMSPYAELVFVLWALDQNPQHPQLIDGSWLQPGWLDHARSLGHEPGLTSSVLSAAPQEITLPGGQRAQVSTPGEVDTDRERGHSG